MRNIDKFMFDSLHSNVLLKYKFDVEVFIESGTFDGRSVQLALDCGFKEIISIEISNETYIAAISKFKNYKNVHLINGDSYFEMPKICQSLTKKSLFWLDAHFDNYSDTRGIVDCPLIHELLSIKTSIIKNHVIMIDDRRVFGNSEHTVWGKHIKEHEIINSIMEINPNYIITYEKGCVDNDIIVAYC
jgi:hypothetical protein